MVAIALILLPWIAALARPHHHLDVATVTVLVSLSLGLPMMWLTWALYRDARSATLVSSLSVAQVADQLAAAVSAQWQAEASMRRLNDPYPLPVAWAAADASLTDSWSSLVRLATTGAGWPPPPPAGSWAAGPEDLAGAGGDLVEVLARVPTGRLVVLGEPGTGKTMLMVRLVLDLLARRVPGGPVPFLASIASWDPAEQDLRSWLCAQLLTNHPALSTLPATRDKPTQAAELLAAGLLLPILDGLDEIREEVRGSAINRINDALRPGEYLVVTCRSDQYRDAVRPTNGIEVTLLGAAAVQLGTLDSDTVSKYLRDDAGGPDARARWDPVLSVLGTEAPAAQALSTPLMVSLARTIYNPRPGELIRGLHKPKELCNSTLTDRTAVESLLLDAFIPAAYRQESTDQAQEAEKWFMFLARYLERKIGSPDLAWWQLPQAVPRFLPEAVTLAGASLFIGILAGAVAGIRLGVASGTLAAVTFGAYTAVLGMGRVLVDEPPKPSRGISFRPPSAEVVGVGILIGVTIGGITAAARGAVAGVVTGVGAGVVTGFAGWSSSLKAAPLDISSAMSPPVVLARDRKAAIIAAALAGAGFGAAAGLLVGEWAGVVAGVVTAVAVGAVAGIYNSFTAAWPFYKIAQILLVLRGRLPWLLMSFLADAHGKGVLRQVGVNYQFRHFELQHRLATRLVIWPSDRYTKAIEQLGSDKIRKRIRAIHILKRAARRSAADHPIVMDALSAFIRQHKEEPQPSEPVIAVPERDVQAALTVIGRRNYRYDQRTINLCGAELPFIRIWHAHLVNAALNGANLTRADLTNTNLSGANLTNANLTRANLGGTKLNGTDLSSAKLTRAKLQYATLRGALLTDANLTRADLSSAHLDGANLTRVDLSFATLIDAHLTDADLTGANLSDAALRGADLSGALWPQAEVAPWGWQRDTDSGRLKRARLSARLRRTS